jgi:hypothetical protein
MTQGNVKKCVMVIDPELPAGVQANTAALLGISIGRHVLDLIGPDISDATGQIHLGLFDQAVTVLAGNKDFLSHLRSSAQSAGLVVIDFITLSQQARTYEKYQADLEATPASDLQYLGIALFGRSDKIRSLTGTLRLLK